MKPGNDANPDLESMIEAMSSELAKEFGAKVRLQVEAAVERKILEHNTRDVMSFVTAGGSRYTPAASVDYVRALWSFVQGKSLNGAILDSVLTAPILVSVEDAVVTELNSDAVRSFIVKSLAPDIEIRKDVGEVIGDEASWLGREFLAVAGIAPASVVVEQATIAVSENASDILSTSLGKTILAGIGQMAITAKGQMLIAKLLTVTVTKVAGTTVLKAAVSAALKKIGIVILIKAVLVKIFGAALPALAAAKIPIFWVLLPILAGFIYHEMKNMPKKLAETLPEKIGSEVEKNFPEITKSFSRIVLGELVQQISGTARPR